MEKIQKVMRILQNMTKEIDQLIKLPEIEASRDIYYIQINGSWEQCPPDSTILMHPICTCIELFPDDEVYRWIKDCFETGHMTLDDEFIFLEFKDKIYELCELLLSIDNKNDETGFLMVNIFDVCNFITFATCLLKLSDIQHRRLGIPDGDKKKYQHVMIHLCQVAMNGQFLKPMLQFAVIEHEDLIFDDHLKKLEKFWVTDGKRVKEQLINHMLLNTNYVEKLQRKLKIFLKNENSLPIYFLDEVNAVEEWAMKDNLQPYLCFCLHAVFEIMQKYRSERNEPELEYIDSHVRFKLQA